MEDRVLREMRRQSVRHGRCRGVFTDRLDIHKEILPKQVYMDDARCMESVDLQDMETMQDFCK